jgi:hypothetical protein
MLKKKLFHLTFEPPYKAYGKFHGIVPKKKIWFKLFLFLVRPLSKNARMQSTL